MFLSGSTLLDTRPTRHMSDECSRGSLWLESEKAAPLGESNPQQNLIDLACEVDFMREILTRLSAGRWDTKPTVL
jgi:hypothetical protein